MERVGSQDLDGIDPVDHRGSGAKRSGYYFGDSWVGLVSFYRSTKFI